MPEVPVVEHKRRERYPLAMEAAAYLLTPTRLRELAAEQPPSARDRLLKVAEGLRLVIDRLVEARTNTDLERVLLRIQVESGADVMELLQVVNQLLLEDPSLVAPDELLRWMESSQHIAEEILRPVDQIAAEELLDCMAFFEAHTSALFEKLDEVQSAGLRIDLPTWRESDLADGRLIHGLRHQFLIIAILELLEARRLHPLLPTMCDLAHESMRITLRTVRGAGLPVEMPPLRVNEEVAAVRWQERWLPDLYDQALRLASATGNTAGGAMQAAVQAASWRATAEQLRRINDELEDDDDVLEAPVDDEDLAPVEPSALRRLLKPRVRGVTLDDMEHAIAKGARGRVRR